MATFAGFSCVDPWLLARECEQSDPPLPTARWIERAGRFEVPLGRKCGRGWFLMRAADLAEIDLTTDHELTFVGSNSDHVRTLSPVTYLRSECVTPGSADDGGAVYLVELVDRRHHLARVPIDRAYNLRAPDGASYLAGTLNAGVAWTWQQVVNNLSNATLGIGNLTLPFTPDGTPESLEFWAPCSAWDALCDVLDRLACAVEYDPEADSFSVARLGEADADFTFRDALLAKRRLWDGYSSEAVRGWYPETVRVVFPRLPLPTGGTSPVYTVDVALAAADGVEAGTAVQLVDDAVALGATGTPSNSAALATRAAERASDWLRKRQGFDRPLLRVYRDYQPAADLLGSEVGRVTYDDAGGPFATAAVSEPDGALERWKPGCWCTRKGFPGFDPSSAGAGSGGGDVWGPDWSYTGAVTLFSDPSGRFIAPAETLCYDTMTAATGVFRRLRLQSEAHNVQSIGRSVAGSERKPTITLGAHVGTIGSEATHFTTSTATRKLFWQHTGEINSDTVGWDTYFASDHSILGHIVAYRFNNSASTGRLEIYPDAGGEIICRTVTFQMWMPHYDSSGTAGASGTFTTADAKTVTVSEGIITSIV